MKIFLSADIEGTAGISDWSDTSAGGHDYEYFRRMMSQEVRSAVLGCGPEADVLVRDGHGSARNLLPDLMPENASLVRGWSGSLAGMMSGVEDADACMMTGYHAHAYSDGNPLSHTSEKNIHYVTINGQYCSEFMYNTYFAAYYNVPVIFVSGDENICREAKAMIPDIVAVPVMKSLGNASVSLQPDKAHRLIQEGAAEAVSRNPQNCMIELPPYFEINIQYKEYLDANKAANYPGVTKIDAKTIHFETDDYYEIKRLMYFVM